MKKKMASVSSIMCVLVMILSACGSNDENVGGEILDVAEIMSDISESTQDTGIMEPEQDIPEDNVMQDAENLELENINQPEKESTVQDIVQPQISIPNNQNQEAEDTDIDQHAEEIQEQAILPVATINGRITSVGKGSFTISKATVVNSDVMVSSKSEDKNEIITVIFEDDTEFVQCISSDGGVTADYTEGMSALLENGKLVEIKGAYEGNEFIAQKVTVYNFG